MPRFRKFLQTSDILMLLIFIAQRGTTPLILATRFGQGSIINLLLDHGAEVDAEDDVQ